ncbi:MAG: hypothetical protein K940chlam7_00836, partial [Chlamydiae bacterium]|nr:hypothetical protein [Chlamydiota bacterium]
TIPPRASSSGATQDSSPSLLNRMFSTNHLREQKPKDQGGSGPESVKPSPTTRRFEVRTRSPSILDRLRSSPKLRDHKGQSTEESESEETKVMNPFYNPSPPLYNPSPPFRRSVSATQVEMAAYGSARKEPLPFPQRFRAFYKTMKGPGKPEPTLEISDAKPPPTLSQKRVSPPVEITPGTEANVHEKYKEMLEKYDKAMRTQQENLQFLKSFEKDPQLLPICTEVSSAMVNKLDSFNQDFFVDFHNAIVDSEFDPDYTRTYRGREHRLDEVTIGTIGFLSAMEQLTLALDSKRVVFVDKKHNILKTKTEAMSSALATFLIASDSEVLQKRLSMLKRDLLSDERASITTFEMLETYLTALKELVIAYVNHFECNHHITISVTHKRADLPIMIADKNGKMSVQDATPFFHRISLEMKKFDNCILLEESSKQILLWRTAQRSKGMKFPDFAGSGAPEWFARLNELQTSYRGAINARLSLFPNHMKQPVKSNK